MKKLEISPEAANAFGSIVILLTVFIVIAVLVYNKVSAVEVKNEHIIIESQSISNLDSIRNEIVIEIDNYISKVSPKSKIDSKKLFNLCDDYNIDVRFVMAQGQIESHYATAGTAAKTNSIFNVGAYDGHSADRQRKNGFGYSNPNESIEPYLILLRNYYLVNGKSEHDLMNNYVNRRGKRYASDRYYEKSLKTVYNRINRTTNLDILLKEYNEVKYSNIFL